MYAHPAVQNNLNVLLSRGVTCIGPAEGELACGVTGKGRMEDPMIIFDEVSETLSGQAPWSGKKVLITAGPTYEKIDPVRFIGNYSSGKMGFALAEAAAKRGATVHLITGPVSLTTQHPNIERIDVESAQQMYDVCVRLFPQTDIGILCAAVADFSPQTTSDTKTKRGEDDLTLLLKPTKDIAATLGNSKRADQVLVGFALETDDELKNAQGKLERKNLDFIVLNSLKDKGAGFRYDTNKIRILNKDGYQFDFPLKSKQEVAEDILDTINDYLI
ncbi:MAG: bifunctional phosphopantothenoylcysteine decarboxylase/phosphopantothenate--cysteine ligase CoaBC, partial [Bacteroidota bacterium]|nr:bifunctional phosphopantothenoylcysteine decarboxylase/phosphopantothenate--cysteine ligase CoaBC [Bacteroidota bacterium]